MSQADDSYTATCLRVYVDRWLTTRAVVRIALAAKFGIATVMSLIKSVVVDVCGVAGDVVVVVVVGVVAAAAAVFGVVIVETVAVAAAAEVSLRVAVIWLGLGP